MSGETPPRLRERLAVSVPIACDQAAVARVLRAVPAGWLPSPARRCGADVWAVRLGMGPASRTVRCQVGAPWTSGGECWRGVSWLPMSERDDLLAGRQSLLTFAGELGSRRSGKTAELMLHGGYLMPDGRPRAAADGAALYRVALVTGERFLAQTAERIVQAAAVLSLAS